MVARRSARTDEPTIPRGSGRSAAGVLTAFGAGVAAVFGAAMFGFDVGGPGSALAQDSGEPATFRGAADIVPGDRVHAAFADRTTGPHRYSFYATAGTRISATVTPDAGSNLSPTLRLVRPGGAPLGTGRSLRTAAGGARLAGYAIPYSGYFEIEVAAARGTGGYTLVTASRNGQRLTGLYPGSPAGDAGYDFYAPAGTRATVRVAPTSRGPRIEITGLVAADGEVLSVLSYQRGAAAEIRDVPLDAGGKYRVLWTNSGAAGNLRLSFRFDLPGAAVGTRELGAASGLDVSVIERGDPTIAARPGYIGSAACGKCHGDLLRSWSDTVHNSAVRAWNRAGLSGEPLVNDANANGKSDFEDGLDLATTDAFDEYGANAPKLGFSAAAEVPVRVTIGAVTYTVDRTMGGNGLWRQRYLTKIGEHYHVLPFEFDESRKSYVPFLTEEWYDGTTPRYASAAAVPKAKTFESLCSGCHNTGVVLESDGAGGTRTGYVEMNIGCEQCHGPGAEHAYQGDVRKILNPRKYKDGTAAGVAKANAVCARCHTNGTSKDPVPGAGVHGLFAYRTDRGVAQAGDDAKDFFDLNDHPEEFWGFKENPIPEIPGNTTLAARSDRQMNQDLEAGPHGPVKGDSPMCFDCHDPHSRKNEHQIASSVDRTGRVPTDIDDNSLCLSCHAAKAPFEAITIADAARIASGNAPAVVGATVNDHMKDIGMPVRDGFYDPKGTGVGRCVTCHMPRTPTVNAPTPDAAGFVQGDLHSHRFQTVWPNASALYGVTNSCNACHPTTEGDRVGPILAEWASGALDGHAKTPVEKQDGVAQNGYANAGAEHGGQRCAECHTTQGFIRAQVKGEALTQADVDGIVKESVALDRGITCQACHGRRGDGRFFGPETNPLRFPKADLCGRCHNSETVTFADFRDRGQVVRHPQQEMIDGVAGDLPAGPPANGKTAHTFFTDGCVTCHFDKEHAAATHDFAPKTASCTACHTGLTTFDRTAMGDYDGNGQIQGIQTEVTGLLNRVKTALLADESISFADGRFDRNGATDHALTGATEAQKRAAYNWYSVNDDKSRGVHNAARAVQLLQRSYKELTGVDIPGATIR